MYRPFVDFHPELAKAETRTIHLPDGGDELPPGGYGFIELYCVDRDCDCQRVLYYVVHEHSEKLMAVISVGFDRSDFLSKPMLDPLHQQSEYADEILELANDMLFSDPIYMARCRRHYDMVKEIVDTRKSAKPSHWWKSKKKVKKGWR